MHRGDYNIKTKIITSRNNSYGDIKILIQFIFLNDCEQFKKNKCNLIWAHFNKITIKFN